MADVDGGSDAADRESDQLTIDDTLDDRGIADRLDEGYSPPERPWVGLGWGTTAREAGERECLDARLARERPEYSPDRADDGLGDASGGEGELIDDEVGDSRSGRLVATDQGWVAHTDREMYATEVGIDGAGASAEEAAMHIVPRSDEPS